MIRENKVKKMLKEGKNVIGTFVKMTDPCTVELITNAGFDALVIDNEHTSMSKETMVSLIRCADATGIVATVRVRENSRAEILQALDAGALGVMVPETSTKEEVELVVSRTKYFPLGNRGYSASQRSANYGHMNAREYSQLENANTMVVVYCETAEAIKNLDEMLSVPDVDVMFVGPFDLSQALGHIGEPGHPEVLEAIDKICKKTRAAGKAAGIISPNAEATKKLFDQGFQYVMVGSDQNFIQNMGKQIIKGIRG
jgi:4-hydroxy-2-oxoheptanedioate aldolase